MAMLNNPDGNNNLEHPSAAVSATMTEGHNNYIIPVLKTTFKQRPFWVKIIVGSSLDHLGSSSNLHLKTYADSSTLCVYIYINYISITASYQTTKEKWIKSLEALGIQSLKQPRLVNSLPRTAWERSSWVCKSSNSSKNWRISIPINYIKLSYQFILSILWSYKLVNL